MSNVFATAGSKYFIGPVKTFNGTSFIESDFTTGSPTWTEIGGATNLGSAGDVAQIVKSDHVAERRTRKAKGTIDAGQSQIICDLDYADAGQLACVAAVQSRDSYAFKVQFNDAPSGGTPSVRYFTAFVVSAPEQLDESNNMMKLNVGLEIDGNIVRVSASA